MIRTTVQVSGMVCGMCEAHVNNAVRSAFSVKKVASSRVRGETVIESENGIFSFHLLLFFVNTPSS